MNFESNEDFSGRNFRDSSAAVSLARDAWTSLEHSLPVMNSVPVEFGNLELGSDNTQDQQIAQWFRPQPHFKSEKDAALLELYRMVKMSDHASSSVEYNAMVGHNRSGEIVHSQIHQAKADNPASSGAANNECRSDLGWDSLPDVLIHSHPLITDGKESAAQLRPWYFFSPPDVDAVKYSENAFGTKVQAYLLGPNGEVLTWKLGDPTLRDKNGEWGRSTMIGKFDEVGNFIPIRKPVIFDHMFPPGTDEYDRSHIIRAATFMDWDNGKLPEGKVSA
ncbi:MAG TPA: hypothetical protein V6C76_09670 [Drouetiella sp.]